MSISQTTLDVLANPPLPTDDADTFNEKAFAFAAIQETLGDEINQTAAAMNLNSTNSTSGTSLTIGVTSKSLTVQAGKSYQIGMWVVIAYTTTPANYMAGQVTSYNSTTGALVVNVQSIGGGGTFTNWTISQTSPGLSGGTLTSSLNYAAPITIASASTVAIGAAASNVILISGSTTINAFDSIGAGAVRKLRFALALTLTYNATSMILPGAANIAVEAGDEAEFVSLGSGNWKCRSYQRALPAATTSKQGIIQKATTSETQTGTDTDKAVTPSGLAASVFGINQNWIDVTGSRVAGTLYPNSTGKVKAVSVKGSTNTGAALILTIVGPTAVEIDMYQGHSASPIPGYVSGLVPPGASYKVDVVSTGISAWKEC